MTNSVWRSADRRIPNDGEAFTDVYNAELDRLESEEKHTWFTAPWLYAEWVVPLEDQCMQCQLTYNLTLSDAICQRNPPH